MYVKIFSKILDSSIWLEPSSTRIVWLTLLAAKDQDGFAQFASLKNLSRRANVSVEEAQAAVDCLCSPDPDSSNPDNDGRRIEKVPGGYMVLNSQTYRNIKDHYSENELTRQRVARHRAKKKKYVTETLQNVTDSVTSVSVSGFVSSNTKNSSKNVPAREDKSHCILQEAIDFCLSEGLSKSDGEYCFNHWEGNGWMNGKNSIKDWKATIRAWAQAKYLPSQRQNKSTESPQERAERLVRNRKNAR